MSSKLSERERIKEILKRIKKEYKKWNPPIVSFMASSGSSPFELLVATVLSLRTKDETTAKAAKRLFQVAKTPQELLKLEEDEIASLIYPVGFYKRKAKQLREIARILVEKFGGKVPDSLKELLELPGVGRKTANLVITEAFGKDGICVDTHVHRITNRLGYVKTKTPEETEMALRKKLPKEHWREINELLVALGQTICHPTSPKCSECPVKDLCPKIGVERSR